jgi:hypothetical protein
MLEEGLAIPVIFLKESLGGFPFAVLEEGLEPSRYKISLDFKSNASTIPPL